MASSDDERDAVPCIVSDYYFEDDKEEPVSFTKLPLQWKKNELLGGNRKPIYLRGKADSGLQEIYIQVTAWRFNLSKVKPKILVLSKDKIWINLQKPRKSFESTIRKILITIHCLHCAKKNPEVSRRSLWEYLSKAFSTYVGKPSENDLAKHTSLISEAVKRDKTLGKAKFLLDFLGKPQKKKKALDEDVRTTAYPVEDSSDDLCAICDDGGNLVCCGGRCMRSFHATVEAGENECKSLGLSDEQVKNFVCKNCQYKQHQCFVCGKLGSSDESSGAEVFSCVSASCGRFYHPHCVAKLLHCENDVEAEELRKKIADGESFTCPIHICFVCKQGEDKTKRDLRFAVCRRCPKSYHRKCLPRRIGFEDDEENGITQRAWSITQKDSKGVVIRKHIVIYCLKHEIDEEMGAPVRNHLKFPDDGHKKKKLATEQLLSKEKIPTMVASRKRPPEKSQKGADLYSEIKVSEPSTGNERTLSGSAPSKKLKVADSSREPSLGTAALNVKKSIPEKTKPSSGERLHGLVKSKSPVEESSKEEEQTKTMTKKPIAKELNDSVQLDADEKERVLAVMTDASSSITMEHILAKYSVPSTHVDLSRYEDKTIEVGKVEGSVKAIRAAVQKLEKGCSIEDAKAVHDHLMQIDGWKNKLNEYLAPFLCGTGSTSEEEDKPKEVSENVCDTSYIRRPNTSTMRRHAPRSDELRTFRPDPHVPECRIDSLGFAAEPYRLFAQGNSAGWIDE